MADKTPEDMENEAAVAEWRKYFRPKSVTWWASVTPFVLGLLLAFATAFGWTPVVTLIGIFAPGMGPGVLMNLGLIGIGLRGAIK